MAYETGGANDVADLIGKLITFAQTDGWTYEGESPMGKSTAPTANAAGGALSTNSTNGLFRGSVFIFSKGGVVCGFITTNETGSSSDPGPFIGCCILPEVPADNLILPPEGTRTVGDATITNIETVIGVGNRSVWTSKMAGPYQAYHFFSGDNYLHVVVEVTPGSFRHFGFGQLEKAGAITDGAYAHCTRWNWSTAYQSNVDELRHIFAFDAGDVNAQLGYSGTVLRADSDSQSPRWIQLRDVISTTYQGWGGWRRMQGHHEAPAHAMMMTGPSELTGRSILIPCLMGVHRPSGNLSIVGAPKDVRWMRIDHLAPGELFSIGPDSWRVFPIVRKNGVTGTENSGNYALAYKVVT